MIRLQKDLPIRGLVMRRSLSETSSVQVDSLELVRGSDILTLDSKEEKVLPPLVFQKAAMVTNFKLYRATQVG